MDTRTFEDLADGQLSVKLIEHNDNGTETWIDFPLGSKTVLCDNEEMAVFDSRIGTYVRFRDIAKGRAEHDSHIARIRAQVPVIPLWISVLENKFNRKFNSIVLTVNKRRNT